jgi:hypothetical protein
MTTALRLLKYAAPVGLIVFCWLTMRTVSSFANESMTSYGVPLSWYATPGASSMAYVIAIGPLLVDLGFYVLSVSFAISWLLGRSVPARGTSKWIIGALWVLACASAAYTFVAVSLDPHFVGWSLDSYYGENARRSYGLQFGVGG